MKTVAYLGVLVLGACASARPANLETASYLVDLVADSGGATMPDHLVFGQGGFESTLCRDQGFQRADYRASRDGAATTFQATARSAGSGVNDWRGSIHGDRIEGTMVSTDEKGSVSSYHYRGRREHGALDGRTFQVVLVADADHGKNDDCLVFTAGSFDSTACHGYGFGAAPYTVAADGTGFLATTASAQNGSMAWQGTVNGDAVSGSVLWTDGKGEKQRSTFKGTAKR